MRVPALTLPQWYDLHCHVRQGSLLQPMLAAHLAMGCCGLVAMPNTKPPVARVLEQQGSDYWSIEGYLRQLRNCGGDAFDAIIIPLYLTADTSPAMIAQGAESGLLRACKYYPPHGTTGADHSRPFETFLDNGVFAAMQEYDVLLCVHGEEHDLAPEAFFDRETNAEEHFYRQRMPRLVERYPNLRVVAEHLTTRVAVDFVQQAGDRVGATVTPQHLLYTIGHLVRNLEYHLYCQPLVKFEADREALRDAVTSAENRRFFAGTDSAPHAGKLTPCGCAAGCFTGGTAPQLYAEAFELAGIDLASTQGEAIFRRFLVENGARFYRLPVSDSCFTLMKEPSAVETISTPEGDIVPLPVGMGPRCKEGHCSLAWTLKLGERG